MGTGYRCWLRLIEHITFDIQGVMQHHPKVSFREWRVGGGGGGGPRGGTPPQETLSFCEGFFLHIDRVAIKLTETPWCQ